MNAMEMLTFWGSCFTILAAAFGFLWYNNLKALPPGPWGLPFIGYLPWIDKSLPHLTFQKLSRRYGSVFSLSMGSLFTVVLTDPRIIKDVLSKDVFSDRANLFLTHGIMKGNGVIAAQGAKWKEQRRFISTFLKNIGMVKIGPKREQMQKMVLTGVSEACRMIDETGGAPVDPMNVLIHSIGNIMNEIIFGIKYEIDDPQWVYLQQLAVEGVKLIGVAGPLNFLPYLRFLPKYRDTVEYIIDGQKKTHDLYRSISEQQTDDKPDNLMYLFKKEMALQRGKSFVEEQMYYLLADMFGAGVDTSVTTIRWLLLYLAVDQSLQEEVYEEIVSVMGDRRTPELTDMQNTPLTEACTLEVGRIKPVTPLGMPHGAKEDTKIQGYTIPQGTMILIPIYTLHTDPNAWEEPLKFNPKRFLDATGKLDKSNDHYLPFLCGKRVCVGDEMARMMMFLYAASILRNYSMTLTADSDVEEALNGKIGITWAPGPHKIIFSPRETQGV